MSSDTKGTHRYDARRRMDDRLRDIEIAPTSPGWNNHLVREVAVTAYEVGDTIIVTAVLSKTDLAAFIRLWTGDTRWIRLTDIYRMLADGTTVRTATVGGPAEKQVLS